MQSQSHSRHIVTNLKSKVSEILLSVFGVCVYVRLAYLFLFVGGSHLLFDVLCVFVCLFVCVYVFVCVCVCLFVCAFVYLVMFLRGGHKARDHHQKFCRNFTYSHKEFEATILPSQALWHCQTEIAQTGGYVYVCVGVCIYICACVRVCVERERD